MRQDYSTCLFNNFAGHLQVSKFLYDFSWKSYLLLFHWFASILVQKSMYSIFSMILSTYENFVFDFKQYQYNKFCFTEKKYQILLRRLVWFKCIFYCLGRFEVLYWNVVITAYRLESETLVTLQLRYIKFKNVLKRL